MICCNWRRRLPRARSTRYVKRPIWRRKRFSSRLAIRSAIVAMFCGEKSTGAASRSAAPRDVSSLSSIRRDIKGFPLFNGDAAFFRRPGFFSNVPHVNTVVRAGRRMGYDDRSHAPPVAVFRGRTARACGNRFSTSRGVARSRVSEPGDATEASKVLYTYRRPATKYPERGKSAEPRCFAHTCGCAATAMAGGGGHASARNQDDSGTEVPMIRAVSRPSDVGSISSSAMRMSLFWYALMAFLRYPSTSCGP